MVLGVSLFKFTLIHIVISLVGKAPALKALAPTQSEPPFLVAQLGLLALFIVLGIFAVRKFHPEQLRVA